MGTYRSGGEYQSGPGHSRATVAIEDTLLSLGVPLEQIRHNSTQLRGGPGAPGAVPGKPDISYVDGVRRGDPGQRVNIEIDTDPNVSRAHQRQLRAFDPTARNIFIVIDPRTGAVEETRVFDPRTGRSVRVAAGPRLSDLVAGTRAAGRVRTDPRFSRRVLTRAAPPARPRRAAPARPPRARRA